MKKTGSLGSSDGKEFICNAGDMGSVPGFGRFPGKWNGSQLVFPGAFHDYRSLEG